MRVRVAVSGARMLHERLKREVETMIANLGLKVGGQAAHCCSLLR